MEPPETLPGKSKWEVGLGDEKKKKGLPTDISEGEEDVEACPSKPPRSGPGSERLLLRG